MAERDVRCHFTVVDDDEHILFFVVRSLRLVFPNAEIQTFHDGAEALVFLKAHQTDFLITDHSMARMNGEELIQSLRASGITVPTLMISNSPYAEKAAAAAGVRLLDKGELQNKLGDSITALFQFGACKT